MIRVLIITVAVLLVLGVVGTALSSAHDQDPVPTIVLDRDPADDSKSGQVKGAADRAKDAVRQESGGAYVSGDGDDDTSFTVAHPEPVEADDERPDAEPDDDLDDEVDDEVDELPDAEPDDEPDDERDDD